MTAEQIKSFLSLLTKKTGQLNAVSGDPYGKLCLLLYDDGSGMIGVVGDQCSSDQMDILCEFGSLDQAAHYLAGLIAEEATA